MGTPTPPLVSVAFPCRSTRRAAAAPGELAGISRYSSGRLRRQDRADASLSLSVVPLYSPHTDGLVTDRFEPTLRQADSTACRPIRHGAAGSDRNGAAYLR